MKLTSTDLQKLRIALLASKLAGLDDVVISEGQLRGLHPGKNAAVLSTLELSIDPAISIGIKRVSELVKRLNMFGEDVLVEGEVTDAKKVRRLSMRGKGASKIEFRCTDEKMITYPKTNTDESGMVLTFTRPEVALISKGVTILGVDKLTLQIKRDGSVHLECRDTNADGFETDLATAAEYVDDAYPYVNAFDTTNNGVFLALLEHMVKDSDTAELVVMRSGNISMKSYGHQVFAIPRIENGNQT